MKSHSEIPWRNVVDMRNMFAHDYGNCDMAVVWETVREDIPSLLEYCKGILKRNNKDIPKPEPLKQSKAKGKIPD